MSTPKNCDTALQNLEWPTFPLAQLFRLAAALLVALCVGLPVHANPPSALEIISQPSGGTLKSGFSFVFTVVASGSFPEYQWRFNGEPINGATSPTLVLINLDPAQSGLYDVVVADQGGFVTSASATLTVYEADLLTQPRLALHPGPVGMDLLVTGSAPAGALFIYEGGDLATLQNRPNVALKTNTPLTSGLRMALPESGGAFPNRFFNARHLPGRSIEEFGTADVDPEMPPPNQVLFTAGVPTNLISGQTFTADFFIGNPAGELLDLSGAVAVLVLRHSDGEIHPDATVFPSTGQLTNGHMRLTLTLQASTSIEAYTLGLGPAAASLSLLRTGLLDSTPSPLDQALAAAFNFPPINLDLQPDIRAAFLDALTTRRSLAADSNPAWSVPLTGSGYAVSGTFGEWRGNDNREVHLGLDLAVSPVGMILASRGGVISFRGSMPGKGDYLVLDHGDGWFSRYLHLTLNPVFPRIGDTVGRGSILGNTFQRSYDEQARYGPWDQHLHFEIRKAENVAHWGIPKPGLSEDPLPHLALLSAIPGIAPPQLGEFGLTRRHPGEHAFVKAAPAEDQPGAVYVFAKMADVETFSSLNTTRRRIGLRAAGFQPEGHPGIMAIRPATEAAINLLLPPGSAAMGFARYDGPHAASPDPASYFRYWWRWDTSVYANDRQGPRSLVLSGEDFCFSRGLGFCEEGQTALFTFTVGPQIEANSITPLPGNQYQFSIIAHLGANTPPELNDPKLFVQPDQYKLEVIQANGTALPGVQWLSPLANYQAHGLTPVASAHLQTTNYTFKLPENTDADGLKLRVSSRLAPDIAHEVGLGVCPLGPITPGPNMVLIPAGAFAMGDSFNDSDASWGERPVHTVYVSGFYMDRYEVTKALWDEVRAWGLNNGYTDLPVGGGKGANHPVHSVNWYDVVKWCNARSEKQGGCPAYYTSAGQTTVYRTGQVNVENGWVKWNSGYRLPTEAEWEKAARGGASGRRFPWGNTISHSQANYSSYWTGGQPWYPYDVNSTSGYHSSFQSGGFPYTSPVGYFEPNGYGLYDMAGNVREWCWDWWDGSYYSSSPDTDPRGPSSGSYRVDRGGSWVNGAIHCRAADRSYNYPAFRHNNMGFRSVLPPGQP